MARKSFTLRKSEILSPEKGSYLQYPAGSEAASVGLSVRSDIDTQLRSDDLTPQPISYDPIVVGNQLPTISFFEINVVDYEELELAWGAPLVESPSTSTFEPTKVVIVYSPLGEPQTIADGTIIVNSNRVSNITHYVRSGRWAYYTLFLRYENNTGDSYYEKATSLSELPPFNYGSTKDMYSKIPEYYRSLDANLDSGDGGPLYRMLSVFGFEADRFRTEIDYLMSCKDPLNAHTQILDTIAKDLSIELRSEEIGASRLREILHRVGTLRRVNGTPASLFALVQAATGSYMSLEVTNTGDKYILIHPQRINYIKDPSISGGARGSLSGGVPRTTSFSPTLDAGGASVPSVTATYDGGAPGSDIGGFDEDAFSQPIGDDQLWAYFPDPLSGGSAAVLQTLSADAVVIRGDAFYFSMHGDLSENAQDQVFKVALYATGSGAASAGYSGTVNDVLIAEATTPILIGNTKYWKLQTSSSLPSTITPTFLAIFVDPEVNVSTGFGKLLLEKMLGGEYFDGSTDTGGWLVDYPSNARVSDYRWYDVDTDSIGDEQKSYSFYTGNYQKVKAVSTRYLPRILPVTEIQPKSGTHVYSNDMDNAESKWQLDWDIMPGALSQYPV